MVQGYCRHDDGHTNVAWQVTPAETVWVGGAKYRGAELIAYAEAVCELCPVQWHCARFAVTTEAKLGTWGASHDSLDTLVERLGRAGALEFIAAADSDDIPVQVAIKRAS